MTRLLALAMLAGACTAVIASRADAYVAPGATIVSASLERLEQADDTTLQVALSGDGRYAVFTTRARNLFADDDPDPKGQFRAGGIFRRDLQSGKLELVAHGDLRPEAEPERVLIRGALHPSVSETGRYVVFSTGWQLDPDDTNGNIDVYRRDMDRPAGDPRAFELVSRTGSGSLPARYAEPPEGQSRPGNNPGSEVTARSSVSADGSRVVFRTADVSSDLPGGSSIGDSPGQQVFLRDLDQRTTVLVTQAAGGAPAGGALGAAVLSADGTTALWVGRNAPAQTRFLPGEGENPAFEYLLWRRVADGEGAITKRVTGFVDPDDPGCSPSESVIESPLASGPCYGPLVSNEGYLGGIVSQVPAISGDGRRVAYLTNSPPRGTTSGGIAADLFVTDVVAGTGRKSTTVEVTRDVGSATASSAPLDGLAMSTDGRWVAVTTLRTQHLLPTLRTVGPMRAQATSRDVQLFDLAAGTVERASIGAGGADTDGPSAAQPAISADGRRVAFLSAATNLFYGDGNDRQDAFVVDRLDAPPADPPPPPTPDEPLPPAVSVEVEPPPPTRLVVRAAKGRSAAVVVTVTLPEPGTGTATARGRLRNADGKRVGSTRTLASARIRATKAARLKVRLTVPKRLRSRLRQAGRLTASTQVQFTGRSGKDYAGRVTVEFLP